VYVKLNALAVVVLLIGGPASFERLALASQCPGNLVIDDSDNPLSFLFIRMTGIDANHAGNLVSGKRLDLVDTRASELCEGDGRAQSHRHHSWASN
jgi:hypothetical protein